MKHSEFVVECSRIHTANIGIHPNLKSSHSVSARMYVHNRFDARCREYRIKHIIFEM